MNNINHVHINSWLTFIRETQKGKWVGKVAIQKAKALYLCKCGKEIELEITPVKNGHIKSCGCRVFKKVYTQPKGRKRLSEMKCFSCKNEDRIRGKSYCRECNKKYNKKQNIKRKRKEFNVDNLLGEEWKDIPGFEGIYQASTIGRIKSSSRIIIHVNGKKSTVSERIRKLVPNNGYLKVQLRKNGKYVMEWVHRLIALTFIPNPENKPQVNHKWGIKTDNRVSELEWATYEEDREHAVKVLGHKWDKGIRHKGKDHVQSKKVKQINPITNEVIKIWDCVSEAQKEGVAPSISMCATGKLRTSGGFKWEYV